MTRALAIPERGIEQLPAGDQVLKRGFQPLNVELGQHVGHARDQVVFKRLGTSTLAILIPAGGPARLHAVKIVIIEINAGGRIVMLLQDALSDHLFDRPERGYGRPIGQPLDGSDTVFLENALHATDGVALAIQQAADAPEQIDIIGAVVATAAAALHRLDLGKPCLPEPQDVLGNVEVVGDLANGSERIRRLVQMLAPLVAPVEGIQSAVPSPLLALWPLIRCFRMADGLNTITRRGEIGTSVPVLGLRPMRWPFLRTMNEPNDESFTVSPFSRQSVISFSTSSTKADDSVRDKPPFW